MGNKISRARSGAIVWDGSALMLCQSGLLSLGTTAASGSFVQVPFDGYIEAIRMTTHTLATTSATGGFKLNVGSATDSDAYVAAASISLSSQGGTEIVNLSATDGTITTRNVTAGDGVICSATAGATAGAAIVFSSVIVVRPR